MRHKTKLAILSILASAFIAIYLSFVGGYFCSDMPLEDAESEEIAYSTTVEAVGLGEDSIDTSLKASNVNVPIGLNPKVSKLQARSNDTFLRAFDTPIHFYGKVVNEHGAPVAGAQIEIGVNDKPYEAGSKYHKISSDDGSFGISGVHGIALSIAIEMEGYERLFYNFKIIDNPDMPTLSDPFIFVLISEGNSSDILGTKQMSKISKEGKPYIFKLFGEHENIASDLVITAWREEAELNHRFDWACQLEIPGGGLVECIDDSNTHAPQDGYNEITSFAMDKTSDDWVSQDSKYYYFKLPTGYYGKMHFKMVSGGDHFFVLEAQLNIAGQRDLD